MGSISRTQAGTMSDFGVDGKLTRHLNVYVWTADPHFALLKEVTFTLMARAKQE